MSDHIYSREELKNVLLNLNFITLSKDNRLHIVKSKISKHIQNQIEILTTSCRDNFSERIYWILNDIFDYPNCCGCNIKYQPNFYGLKRGYWKASYCSHQCQVSSKHSYDKRQEKCLTETGFTHHMKNPKIVERISDERLERTGYRHQWADPAIIEQRRLDYKDKTGYDNPGQNPEVQLKMANTLEMKTGFRHNFADPTIIAKGKITSMKNWGVLYPMQHPAVFTKQQHSAKSYKTYISETGRKIIYQGYELVAIKVLLENYEEDDIITDRYQIPEIWYEFNSELRRYFPDIYIQSQNLIIEVKSIFTFEQEETSNLLKRQACLNLGYNFKFWICSSKEVLQIW